MRWKTRSEPERSTSIWMFGYSARNTLAIASATFTSTEVYQTTFPSFAAAAIIAGVVSCAKASPDSRTMENATTTRSSLHAMLLILLMGRIESAGEPAAAFRVESYRDRRAVRYRDVRRRSNQQILADVDDVVAMASEVGLAAH